MSIQIIFIYIIYIDSNITLNITFIYIDPEYNHYLTFINILQSHTYYVGGGKAVDIPTPRIPNTRYEYGGCLGHGFPPYDSYSRDIFYWSGENTQFPTPKTYRESLVTFIISKETPHLP